MDTPPVLYMVHELIIHRHELLTDFLIYFISCTSSSAFYLTSIDIGHKDPEKESMSEKKK